MKITTLNGISTLLIGLILKSQTINAANSTTVAPPVENSTTAPEAKTVGTTMATPHNMTTVAPPVGNSMATPHNMTTPTLPGNVSSIVSTPMTTVTITISTVMTPATDTILATTLKPTDATPKSMPNITSTVMTPVTATILATTLKPTDAKPKSMPNITSTTPKPTPKTENTTKPNPAAPTSTPKSPTGRAFSNIEIKMKIEGIKEEEIDEILNITSSAREQFETAFKRQIRNLFKDTEVIDVIIIMIRRGSIIVEYTIVYNGTNTKEVKAAIDTIQQQIDKGKLGNFTVDKDFSTNAKVTISADQLKTCEEEKTDDTLFILLCVAVAVVGLLVILIIILICLYYRRNSKDISNDLASAG